MEVWKAMVITIIILFEDVVVVWEEWSISSTSERERSDVIELVAYNETEHKGYFRIVVVHFEEVSAGIWGNETEFTEKRKRMERT